MYTKKGIKLLYKKAKAVTKEVTTIYNNNCIDHYTKEEEVNSITVNSIVTV